MALYSVVANLHSYRPVRSATRVIKDRIGLPQSYYHYFLHWRIVWRGLCAAYKDVEFYLLYKERQLE